MSSGAVPHYRLDLRIRGDRLIVNVEGPPGPDADRHLSEVRAAAAKCDLAVVVSYGTTRPASESRSLRRPRRVR